MAALRRSDRQLSVSMAFYCHRELVRGDDEGGRRIVDADLRGGVDELAQLGAVELVDEMAIVSLVGQEMKNMVGISGAMLSVLGKHDINIEMISQGEFLIVTVPYLLLYPRSSVAVVSCFALQTNHEQEPARSTSPAWWTSEMPIAL